jgi:hypothetical protein
LKFVFSAKFSVSDTFDHWPNIFKISHMYSNKAVSFKPSENNPILSHAKIPRRQIPTNQESTPITRSIAVTALRKA